MLQEEGASTEVTGTEVCSRADIMAEKGGRTSPEKEKPERSLLDGYFLWGGGGGVGISKGKGMRERARRGTEDGVNDVVCDLEVGFEVLSKGDVKVFELFGEALRLDQYARTLGSGSCES